MASIVVIACFCNRPIASIVLSWRNFEVLHLCLYAVFEKFNKAPTIHIAHLLMISTRKLYISRFFSGIKTISVEASSYDDYETMNLSHHIIATDKDIIKFQVLRNASIQMQKIYQKAIAIINNQWPIINHVNITFWKKAF